MQHEGSREYQTGIFTDVQKTNTLLPRKTTI